MEQLLKVEGHQDLARDPELRDAVREINSLKCEMQEMKSLLLKLVDKD